MFVNMYIFNNIACEFIYMNTHMYRVCITQTHTHVYMLYAVALIHKQLFSCLTFMVFFFNCPTKETDYSCIHSFSQKRLILWFFGIQEEKGHHLYFKEFPSLILCDVWKSLLPV